MSGEAAGVGEIEDDVVVLRGPLDALAAICGGAGGDGEGCIT